MEHIFLLAPRLDLFDAGAPAGAPAGDSAEAAPVEVRQTGPGGGRRGKAGGTEKVVYGKTARQGAGNGPPGESALPDGSKEGTDGGGEAPASPAPAPDDRRARFEAMISGDMKDLFDERVQGLFERRSREVKALQAQVEACRPILDMISRRYDIKDADPAKLAQALDEDDAYWEQAAQRQGMTVPQYKEYARLQRENQAFREAQRAAQGEQAAQRQYAKWMQEAKEVRTAYPDFRLEAECRDPQFMGMLKAGVPVKHAYEVLHLGEIKQNTAKQAAQRTEKQVTDTIRAKGARPSENGVSSASGIIVKSDPSKLTKADRAEIARRVARGETIAF